MKTVVLRIGPFMLWLILIPIAGLLTIILLGFAQLVLLVLGSLLCLAAIASVVLMPRHWIRELESAIRSVRGNPVRIVLLLIMGVIVAIVLRALLHDILH